MEVVIAGGHGKIALHLARLLADRGDSVRSLIRNPDQERDIADAGAEAVICDLEEDDEERIARAVGEADAIVFAAGAGPGSGPERKETMDYGGAVKLIAAAKANGVGRYVIVSSMGADASHEGDDTFDVYLRAKGRADEELAASGLRYTIVRPGGLTDAEPTGRVFAAESGERGEIPRADVAAVIAEALHQPAAEGKTFEVISGRTPVEEAVAAL
jgi:nucleoside-diphosphate-sugar epimerase